MKKRNILKMGIVVLVIAVLLSSATAVPLSNQKVVDNTIKQEQQETNNRIKNRFLEALHNLIMNILGSFGVSGPIYSLVEGDDVIDECYKAYNNETVRAMLAEAPTLIDNELDVYPVEERQMMKEFLAVNDTFGLDPILGRIQSLHVGSVYYDIQELLELDSQEDNETFTQHNTERIETVLTIWYNHNCSNTSLWDMSYPVIDEICAILQRIAIIWLLPAAILGGLYGLAIASVLSMVFFAPIVAPMALYIGFCEALKNDEEFWVGLGEIAFLYGLVGLLIFGLPVFIDEMFNGGWIWIGLLYVLDRLMISEIGKTKGDEYYYVFSNTAPSVESVSGKEVYGKTGKIIELDFIVRDWDYLTMWNSLGKYRDSVQLLIDDSGEDYQVDWVSPLCYNEFDWPKISYCFSFSDPGVHKVHIRARDSWGALSGWTTINFHIRKDKDKQLGPHFLLEHFPNLMILFNRLFNRPVPIPS